MKKYIIAIDQGTTSTKVVVFDREGNVVVKKKKSAVTICNKPGWVEQDASVIASDVICLLSDILTDIDVNEVASIGITNQRETTVIWDKKSGKPIYNAIVWSSKHSSEICSDWIDAGYDKIVKEKTGLLINPYFSASKIRWILDNCEYDDINDLMFGTIDSYLCYVLSGRKEHVSDVSNASRTMLFNIHSLTWDDELLELFDIKKDMLPKVVDTAGYVINVDKDIIGKEGLTITSIVGDQQSSLFGQGCVNNGDVKDTYGTGCFLLANSGDNIVNDDKLLATVAWRINGKVSYAIEGSIFLAGGLIEWLSNNINMIAGGSSIKSIDINSNGVYFVPALTGLAAPYWNNDIKGSFLGLTLASDRMNMVSAVLEAIAFSNKELIELMNDRMNNGIKNIVVDGGLTLNDSLMQLQADVLSVNLYKNNQSDSTALGAALLAGLGCGFYKNVDDCMNSIGESMLIKRNKVNKIYKSKYKTWKKAVKITSKF